MTLLKIDESQKEFIEIRQQVTNALCEITNLISQKASPSAIKTKIETMIASMGIYKEDNMLTELIACSAGENSTIDNWLKQQPISENDFSDIKSFFQTHEYNNKIHSGAVETRQEMSSQWAREAINKEPSMRPIVSIIEEIVRSEIFFLNSIAPAKLILNSYLKYADSKEQALINQYIVMVNPLDSDFIALELDKLFISTKQSIEDIITKLLKKYQSDDFKKYQDNLLGLALIRNPLLKLQNKYNQKNLGLSNQQFDIYIAPLFQRTSRYPLLLEELKKQIKKIPITQEMYKTIESALLTAQTRAAINSGQEQMISLKLPTSNKLKIIAILRALSEVEFTNAAGYSEEKKGHLEKIQQRSYVESLLCEGFADIFFKAETDN